MTVAEEHHHMEGVPELTAAEIELLLACARTSVDDAARGRIDAALRAPIRWAPLVDAAQAHGVLPLLHASLALGDPGLVPPPALERIRIDVRANVHHALFFTAELLRLLAKLHAAGVTAIPFKGPVLGAMAYGDVTLRQFSDLDIFVPKSQLASGAGLLLADGYRSATHDGAAVTARSLAADGDVAYRGPSSHAFYRADGRCRVDLQWRLAERFFAFALEDDAAAWEIVRVPVAGRTVSTFAAADTLLILCVHGTKHHWEQLKWICDVAECIRAQGPAIDWPALEGKASRLRAGRMLGLGLRLAEDVLGAPLPAEVSRRLRSDRALDALVRECRAGLFAPAAASPSSEMGPAFYLRTKDGWPDRVRFWATFARQVVARLVRPNAHDVAWIALPPPLAPLYYVLRPVRVLATYAGRFRKPVRRAAADHHPPPAPHASPPPAGLPTTTHKEPLNVDAH